MTHTHDTLMALATDFGVTSLRVGSYERKDIYENSSVASYRTVDLRKEREIARAALSAAIADLVAERDALAKDAARYRWLKDNVHPVYARQQFGEITDYNMKWQIKPYLVAVTAVASDVSFDEALDIAMKGTPT